MNTNCINSCTGILNMQIYVCSNTKYNCRAWGAQTKNLHSQPSSSLILWTMHLEPRGVCLFFIEYSNSGYAYVLRIQYLCMHQRSYDQWKYLWNQRIRIAIQTMTVTLWHNIDIMLSSLSGGDGGREKKQWILKKTI